MIIKSGLLARNLKTDFLNNSKYQLSGNSRLLSEKKKNNINNFIFFEDFNDSFEMMMSFFSEEVGTFADNFDYTILDNNLTRDFDKY